MISDKWHKKKEKFTYFKWRRKNDLLILSEQKKGVDDDFFLVTPGIVDIQYGRLPGMDGYSRYWLYWGRMYCSAY